MPRDHQDSACITILTESESAHANAAVSPSLSYWSRGVWRTWAWVAIRCPTDLAPIMRKSGGIWEPGSKRWLVERRRIGPVVRALQRETDPLFRRAGLSLD